MIINMYLIISDNQKQLWLYGDIQMNVNEIFKYQPTYPKRAYTCHECTCHDKSLKLYLNNCITKDRRFQCVNERASV